ncbi:MAG: L-aspartate oxidase [Thermomicrobiales bacterium]
MTLATRPEAMLDSQFAHVMRYDAVVIGAGVAGLSFALRLPGGFRIALLTKGTLGESNTRYAQGGISAAIGPDDSPLLHEEDTLAAGAGLCDPAAVRALVEGAPEAVEWLTSIGAQFDIDQSGHIALGKEAAHSRHRVLHAGGDATGAEVERAMAVAVRQRPGIDIFENAFALDLITKEGACQGLYCWLPSHRAPVRFESQVVVLAAGGAGQVWAVTSNPPGATADGLAMALRAGIAVADLEFVQFHPTVLAVPGTDAFLVTEAVRGEGAYLRDSDGRRFMETIHPLAELAPRDVVARGIQSTMASTSTQQVFLDLRHLDGEAMTARFPTITRELNRRGLSIGEDLIPVAPAAHYFIGGVAAETDGRSSMPGLLALGEAACSGVHGANRLASNSLLEGLVFGKSAAEYFGGQFTPGGGMAIALPPGETGAVEMHGNVEVSRIVSAIQTTMSAHAAVVRDAAGLQEASRVIGSHIEELANLKARGKAFWEALNLGQAALAILGSAQFRVESRGAHYRADHPETDIRLDGQHTIHDPVSASWTYGNLSDRIGSGGEAIPDVSRR